MNETADEGRRATALAAERPFSLFRRSPASQDWFSRALFGTLLAALALFATVAGGLYFAAWTLLVALAAIREWHRLVGGPKYGLTLAASGSSIAAAVVAVLAGPQTLWPPGLLLLGSFLAVCSAYAVRAPLAWNALGPLYVGLGAVSLVALRMQPHGWTTILFVFIAVWAADTTALVSGRILRGPKLAPSLSPNKTWSGLVMGSVVPAAAVAVYVAILGGNAWRAAVLGLVLALFGHCGDLFESWAKRRVGQKNSGGLIPGHGGVLDRIDSMLFVAPLAAALVFVFGLDPLFGGHP